MEPVNSFIQKTYQKDITETILIQNHCSGICNSFNKFHMKNVPSFESRISSIDDGVVPGVPGTLQDGTKAISQCFNDYLNILDEELKNLWTSLSSQFIQFDEDEFKKHQSVLTTAVNKYNQLKLEISRMSNAKGQIILRFTKYTSKITNSDSKDELAQFRMQYDEIVKTRNSLSKRRNTILSESQEFLDTTRKECEALSKIFTEYNTNVKNYYLMFYDFFMDTYNKLKELSDKNNEFTGMIDATTDFRSFIEDKKIIRSDIGFDFVEFDTSSPAFSGCKPCPKIEIPVDFPIAMAKVTKNYKSDEENVITCKKGKNIFLVEFPEKEWCYAMKPFTWSTGFVPSCCIERIGTKFGTIKKDKLPKAFGEACDFVAIISEDENNYFIENIYGQQISCPKDGISMVFD